MHNPIAPDDYASMNTTVTFAPGVMEMSVIVMTEEDSVLEGDEVFMARLFNPMGASLGPFFEASVTIADNDG